MAVLTSTTYLEAPTLSAVVPNEAFTFAVFVETTYSFLSHSKTVELKLLDLSTQESRSLLEDDSVTPPVWLNNEQVVWLGETPSGNTNLIIANVHDIENRYIAGTIPGPASTIKVKLLDDSLIAVAFAVKVNADGTVHNPNDEPKRTNTAKFYTSNFVRHWDDWTKAAKNAIFYGALGSKDNKNFALSNISNACIRGHESPIPPFGGADHFDLGKNGVIYMAKDPAQDTSLHTKCDCYFAFVTDFRAPPRNTSLLTVENLHGYAHSPRVSPSGKTLVYLKMKTDGHEADLDNIILVENFDSDPQTSVLDLGDWQPSLDEVSFYDEDNLLLIADMVGVVSAFTLAITAESGHAPKQITHSGSISSAMYNTTGKLLLTQSTMGQPAFVEILKFADNTSPTRIDLTRPLLSPTQVSDIWWEGAAKRKVHGFVLKPSTFDDSKTYPVCFLIHGGPQQCFTNSWEPYFSVFPQIFAEAGYIVVMPQYTGSRSYGQAFIDAIQKDWGGAPYEDIKTCFNHVEQNMPAADTKRMIFGGLSWGGWMTNWIQGQDFGRRFKALFTLNGIFSMDAFQATEELYFPRADFGGLPWESQEARAIWQKWDASAHAGNWATPHLIVHTEKDFRCGIEHGMAAFNVLQAKGIPSAFLDFEDECHLVQNPENLRAMYQVLLHFLNPFVGLDKPATATGEDVILPVR